MARDYSRSPDDDNGDVLWNMAQDGDSLIKRREINFSIIYPSEDAALEFAVHLLRNGQKYRSVHMKAVKNCRGRLRYIRCCCQLTKTSRTMRTSLQKTQSRWVEKTMDGVALHRSNTPKLR